MEKAETAKLYAGYDLYIDAGEGNIPFKRHAILDFLMEKLDFFWKKIQEPVSCTANNKKPVEKVTKVTNDLIDKIREIVYQDRFMSIDDLMKKLDNSISRELVYEAQEYIPEIRIFTHPNTTVFQWQNQ